MLRLSVMRELLTFLLCLLAAEGFTLPPLFGPYETPVPVPDHGDLMFDGVGWAKVYHIMPGFEIWTYPGQETPPSEDQIRMLQFNLRARFRHISRDAKHSLYDEDQGFCRMELGTRYGGHCWVTGKAEPLISHTDNEFEHGLRTFTWPTHGCSWNVHHNPPTAWFKDDGFGTYGIRWTAVRGRYSTMYQGGEWVQGGWGCHHEGLCFPQIVFFRRGYRLVISTWKIPTARREFCEWNGGYDGMPETKTRYELCVDRTDDNYDHGGSSVHYVCSVPCWNDGNIDVEQPHHLGQWDEFHMDPQWNETASMWTWTEGVDTCI